MHEKNIYRQKKLGNIFKMNMQRAVFRTKSKVYGGAFLQKKVNDFQKLTIFAIKSDHKC